MSIDQLALIMALVCGKGMSDKVLDCQDLMINCAVQYAGVIEEENVKKCVERAKEIK